MVSGSPCRDIVFNGYVSYVLSYVCSIHASTPVRSSRKIVMEITTVARISSYTRLDSIFMNHELISARRLRAACRPGMQPGAQINPRDIIQ